MSAGRAALLTPPGAAGIASIGVWAVDNRTVRDSLFRPYHRTPPEQPQLGEILENGRRVDEVIVSSSAHTGGFEIHCHGGVRIVQRVLLLLQRQGLEVTPWENLDTPTSIEQEIEVTLPLMRTAEAVKRIAVQATTGLTSWVSEKKRALQQETARVAEIAEQAAVLKGTYELARRLKSPPLVVVAGPANAGKSTLVNALTGRMQSLVADLPGTTRDWTEQLTDMGGLAVRLVDTAGRRSDADELEQAAQSNAGRLMDQADLVILLTPADSIIDLQRTVEPWLGYSELPTETPALHVISKCGLLENPQERDIETPRSADSQNPPIRISALHRQGLDELRGAVAGHFEFDDDEKTDPLIFTQRQMDVLDQFSQESDAEVMAALLENLLDSHDDAGERQTGEGVS